MKINDIRFGDIVTYRSGRINNVNNPDRYYQYFNKNFENISKGMAFDITKICKSIMVLQVKNYLQEVLI